MSREPMIVLLVLIVGALVVLPMVLAWRGRGRSPAEPDGGKAGMIARSPDPANGARTPPAPSSPEAADRPKARLGGVGGRVSASALRTVRDRVEADPAEAARVVRRWLNEGR